MSTNPEHIMKGSNGTFETMKVKADNDQGYMLINKHDFDPEQHEPFEGQGVGSPAKGKKKASKDE